MNFSHEWFVSNHLFFRDPEDENAFADLMQETLEIRIGEHMSEGLTDDQLDEFEYMLDHDTPDEEIAEWLDEYCPNYRDIISEEEAKLKQEVLENRSRIV